MYVGPKVGPVSTHRLAWELEHGPIPEHLGVLHLCDNAKCVNVAHLMLGDQAENMRQMAERRRSARGERHGMSKLTKEDVLEARALRNTFGLSYKLLGDVWGLSEAGMRNAIKGRNWNHI